MERVTMKNFLFFISALVLIQGCTGRNSSFEKLESEKTGIDFNNIITESDSFNVLQFEYIYNGSGVAIGDVNNDGLQDIFFGGNITSSRLYLNQGNFTFKDVTELAGVHTNYWCTGISMIDINHDGLLDIHVSTIHPDRSQSSPNLFFLNKGISEQGIPRFEECAALIGLADRSYSTQAVFLDFDKDGDLDMYLVNNALETYNRNIPLGQRTDGIGKSIDKLYRNEGLDPTGYPFFKDVSAQAGILSEGWGLGVVVNDFNNDSYPDIYVSNDFISSDQLYINQKNGTFKDEIANYFKHEEYNGMGMDIADINNDGYNDVMVTDMMPEDNLRQKTMFSSIGYDKFKLLQERGYQTQYVRNVLQFNNGNNSFSDIGYLSGIFATDWSWSGLFADLDNDGFRDLLVTNGYRKDITDLDFTAYTNETLLFGTMEVRTKKMIDVVNGLEGVKKPNFVFHNNGDLTFTDKASEWGMDQPGYSNGAAYGDLDNDGDLDLVMNNINDPAFIYKNNAAEKSKNANYLRIRLEGAGMNAQAIGAKVYVYNDGKFQFNEHHLQRGYKSTVEPFIHFGLGKIQEIDSVVVYWPTDGKTVLKNIKSGQVLTIREVSKHPYVQKNIYQATIFQETHKKHQVFQKQKEDDFVDYKQGQALLPHKHSQLGPGIAVSDIDKDGLDDFVIGAPAGKASTLYYQHSDGTFHTEHLPEKKSEDMGMLLFDADQDGDDDLYCVSGSSEFGKQGSPYYQDRFYRNNGKQFIPDTLALPRITSSGSCVVASDFDKDGDLDLFIGGRISPVEYPTPAKSYLLQNNGKGIFTDITEKAQGLSTVGMVTSAIWTDVDNDSWMDLLLVGEWMPITVYKNKGGMLQKSSLGSLPLQSTVGWWNSITGGDFDNDGDTDYIAGNLGLNSLYKASVEQPVCIYAKDFDGNGSIDPVLCRYIQGKEYITHSRETLTEQIVSFKKTFTSYARYGKSTFEDIFTKEKLQDALIYKATCFTSVFLENSGAGEFNMKPLPVQAQFSPLFGMVTTDVDHDGNLDLLAVGNSYSTEPLTGYYDAGIGAYLKGDGLGNFSFVPVSRSGFFVDSDAKGMAMAFVKNKKVMIVTSNQDSVRIFENNDVRVERTIALRPDDAFAVVSFPNGKKQKIEFYYGSGYLSQSNRRLTIPGETGGVSVIIYTYRGAKRSID